MWGRHLYAEQPERRLLPDEVLFTAEDIRDRFGFHTGRWLDAAPAFKPVLDMFFATRYADTMFEEDRFQNLAQSAEAYHRRVDGNRPDPLVHAERTQAVLTTAPEDLREWLGAILLGAGEYRLSDRLEALIARHPWIASEVIPKANAHR